MGLGGLGMWEMIMIFLVVLLLFGAKRLPEIGSSLGKRVSKAVYILANKVSPPCSGTSRASKIEPNAGSTS